MSRNTRQRRRRKKTCATGTTPPGQAVESMRSDHNRQRAALLKAEAESLNNAGRKADAIPLLKQALTLDPSLADVHLMLAVTARMQPHLDVNMREITAQIKQTDDLIKHYRSLLLELKRQKQFAIALIAQEEMCRLLPGSLIEKSNLVEMLCSVNQQERAALVMAELLDSEPGNRAYKARFNRICTGLAFRNFDPLLKRALQSCFDKLYEFDFVKIYPAWITLVFLDPSCSAIRIAERLTNEENLFDWLETASLEEMNFFSERFFLDGLRLLYPIIA